MSARALQLLAAGGATSPPPPPPPPPSPVLLLSPSGSNGSTTITDASPAAHGNGTINGSTIISTAVTYGGNPTIRFNGGAALGWNDHADFDLGVSSGDPWCIEQAINFFGFAGDQFITAKWGSSGDSSYVLHKAASTNSLTFTYTLDGTTNITVTATWSPSTSVWYELAANYDGSKIRLFIDGVMVASSTVGAIALFNSTTLLSVGCNTALNSFLMNASVGRLRVTKSNSRSYGDAGYTPDAAGYYV